MHTDDDAGTQTGSPARPSVGYPIVIDKQGQTAYRGSGLRRPVRIESPSFVQAQDGTFYPSLPLLFDRLCHILRHSSRSNPVCGHKMSSVLCKIICFLFPRHNNYICKVKNYCSTCCFASIHRIFVKVEQKFSNTQMPF